MRVEAARLRSKLGAYYQMEGEHSAISIDFPKGGYVPVWGPRTPARDIEHLPPEPNTIVVLPFEDLSQGKDCAHLAGGLTEEITTALMQLDELRIVASRPGSSLSGSLLMQGTVRTSGRTLRVTVRLISSANMGYLWSERYEREIEDSFGLQDEIAQAVASALRVRLLGGLHGGNAETQAYNAYLIGRHHWNKRSEDGLKKSIPYFEEAIRKNPGFALAHTAIANACCLLANYGAVAPMEICPRAKAAAIESLRLDKALPDAHTSMAHILASYDWKWTDAEREHNYAISLSPAHAHARHWYATDCLTPQGRLDEALQEIQKSRQGDPVSLSIARDVALIHYYRRDYSKAMQEARKALELDSNFYGGYWILGLAYEQQAMYVDAIEALRDAQRLSGGSPRMVAALGHCYAVSGHRENAEHILQTLQDMLKYRYVSPVELATVGLGLGRIDTALEWLSRGREVRCSDFVYQRVEPRMDPLRSHAGFDALMSQASI